jgi:hypothetical protein
MRMSEHKSTQKVWYWSVRLGYDPRALTGVTTTRLKVVGVLQLVSKPILMVSQAHMGQLRRIW